MVTYLVHRGPSRKAHWLSKFNRRFIGQTLLLPMVLLQDGFNSNIALVTHSDD